MCSVRIFCDFRRAFDCLNNKILFERCKEYKIFGSLYQWIKYFLSIISQSLTRLVRYYQIVSNTLDITRGIPLGSVMGPVLFTLYINELKQYLQKGRIYFILKWCVDCTNIGESPLARICR